MQSKAETLIARLKNCKDPMSIQGIFLNVIPKIESLIASKNMSKSWKEDNEEFRLYYWENIPKKPFELYLTTAKFERVVAIEKKIELMKPKKNNFTYVG